MHGYTSPCSDFRHYEVSSKAIIKARDKWLKPGGAIFPDQCNLYISGFYDTDIQQTLNYWRDVYGFTMKPIQEEREKTPMLCDVHKRKVNKLTEHATLSFTV